MKKIFKYSILLLSITMLSCDDYLDVESFDRVADDNVIFDKSSAETAIRGAYRSLASLNYSSSFQNTILQSGGDVRSLNNAQTDLNIINYDLRSDIGFLSTYWANFYNTINRANHVIQKVPNVNDLKLTAELRNQLLGEAYFIRASSYFDLGRVFGGVQLFLTPTTKASDKLGVPRSSQAQVYDQAIADLNLAEQLLPATVVRNRATKFTASALKARVHLYQNKFAEAEIDVNNVLVNTGYRLIKPFNLAAGTTESVLEYSYSVNDVNTGYSLWNTSNRSTEPKAVLHNLLNDPAVGGGRKILSVKNAAGQFIGGIYPTNTSAAYAIRTAELYLIRAEARARKTTPDLTGALSDLNIVRDRSGLTNSPAVTKEQILLAIEEERRVEFALEPDRWFDLVRTGRAKTVLSIANPDKYIFPIPASERLADPSLSQNPSY